MPFTMKQLTKRYGVISVDRDDEAPAVGRRKLIADRLLFLGVQLAKLEEERDELKATLKRRRVKFVSGRTKTAEGIVVGEGDTQAEALADAGRRLGRG